MALSSQHVHFNATVYSRVRELDFSLVRFVSCKHAAKNVFSSVVFMCFEIKGKVKSFTYSLPSVGPGADPGVQAVSPQVT